MTRIEDHSHPDDPRQRRKLFFACPRREGHECHVLLKPWPVNAPTWTLTGDEAAPTLEPSISCGDCGWHGFIRSGKTVGA